MGKPISVRQFVLAMVVSLSVLAVACLLLGLTAGHSIMRSIGLAGLLAELDSLSVALAVVGSMATLVVLAIGVGLCTKGFGERQMKAMVQGTIRSTTFRAVPSDDPEYGIFSWVSYCVDGVSYHSEGQHHDSSPSKAAANERLASIRPGDPVNVHYRTSDPDVIALDAPPSRTLTVLLVGLWLLTASLGTMFLNGVVFAN